MDFTQRIIFLAMACAASVNLAAQQDNDGPTRTFNVARVTTTGEKVRGPLTLVLENVNVLRYDVKIGQTVTFPPGPDLSKLGFIPPVTPPATQPSKEPQTKAISVKGFTPPNWNDAIEHIFEQILLPDRDFLQDDLSSATSDAGKAVAKVNKATSAVTTLVTGSDALLQTDSGAAAIVGQIDKMLCPIKEAVNREWPDDSVTVLAKNVADLQNWVNELPAQKAKDWGDWYVKNKSNYDNLKSAVADLKTKIAELNSSGKKAQDYNAAKEALKGWRGHLKALKEGGEKSFKWTVPEKCGFTFSTNKEIKVVLNKVDRLASKPAPPVSEEVVTVVCSSPLTVSAGFGFAGLSESNFALVQSTGPTDASGKPTVVSKFGLTSQSSFRTVPAVLVNTRLHEWNDTFAFHFSTGAAVSLSSGAAGNDVEYIAGGSVSFRRAATFTLGVEVGRESSLAGGFLVGQVVPAQVSSPPIRKTWAVGPAFVFTYIIR